MTAKKSEPTRYRAKHAFSVNYDGEQITVNAGEIVRAGHPLLDQIGEDAVAEHFVPFESFGRFDVEQASAEPGSKR